MKKTKILHKTALSATVFLFAGLISAGTVDVKPLVDKMPAPNAAEEKAVFDELTKGGKDAVLAVCETLVPPETGGDSKARYAIGGLAFYVARPGAEAERRMFSGTIMEAVQKAQDSEIKSFLLGLMRWCGGKENLPALAACLGDSSLTEPAAMALCSIRAEGTADILLKALENAKGKQVITLVKALGELQADKAVSAIAKLATDEDRDLRRTALYALANIGQDGSSGSILKKACQARDPLEKSIAGSLYLHYANRIAESGKKKQAAAVCREVIALSSEPGAAYLLPEALDTLAVITGDDAIPDLVTALNSSNRVASVAAMNSLIRMKSKKAVAELGKVLKDGRTHLRLALLNTITPADCQAFADSIAPNLKNEDPEIRIAAINAITGKAGLSCLLELLKSWKEEDLPEIKKAVLLSAGKNEMKDLSAAMANSPAPARAAILDILGQRCATTQAEAVLGAIADPDPVVRLAAMKAIGTVAPPEYLEKIMKLFLNVQDTTERTALLRSATAVAKNIPDTGKRADAFLPALSTASDGRKEMILGALPEIGGQKALDAVIASTGANDEKARNAAIIALSNWPDKDAAASIIKMASLSTNLTQQVLLIRGYVRLVREEEMKPETKIGMIREVLTVAKRPDEKKLILGALTDVKTVESLNLVGTYFNDPDVREEAASLAALIGCPGKKGYKGLTDPAVKPVLEKAAAIVKDEKTKKKIKAQIAKIK